MSDDRHFGEVARLRRAVMARRFTSGTPDRIHVGSAGFGGLDFRFGTVAALIHRSADTGAYEAFLSTNEASGACIDWGLGTTDLRSVWDGTNIRTGATAVTAGGPYLLAFTKATGTVAGRFHIYRFATNAWTHTAASGISPDSAAMTSLTLGAKAAIGGDNLSSEVWCIGMWQGRVMTDSEIKRLARGRWLETSPDFYVQWTDGREVNDMTATLGTKRTKQTARTGTTRGVQKPPPGFRFGPVARRR